MEVSIKKARVTTEDTEENNNEVPYIRFLQNKDNRAEILSPWLGWRDLFTLRRVCKDICTIFTPDMLHYAKEEFKRGEVDINKFEFMIRYHAKQRYRVGGKATEATKIADELMRSEKLLELILWKTHLWSQHGKLIRRGTAVRIFPVTLSEFDKFGLTPKVVPAHLGNDGRQKSQQVFYQLHNVLYKVLHHYDGDLDLILEKQDKASTARGEKLDSKKRDHAEKLRRARYLADKLTQHGIRPLIEVDACIRSRYHFERLKERQGGLLRNDVLDTIRSKIRILEGWVTDLISCHHDFFVREFIADVTHYSVCCIKKGNRETYETIMLNTFPTTVTQEVAEEVAAHSCYCCEAENSKRPKRPKVEFAIIEGNVVELEQFV